jgi:hypothetical protein
MTNHLYLFNIIIYEANIFREHVKIYYTINIFMNEMNYFLSNNRLGILPHFNNKMAFRLPAL